MREKIGASLTIPLSGEVDVDIDINMEKARSEGLNWNKNSEGDPEATAPSVHGQRASSNSRVGTTRWMELGKGRRSRRVVENLEDEEKADPDGEQLEGKKANVKDEENQDDERSDRPDSEGFYDTIRVRVE